ncbi:pyrroline-5-carboxylate reductase [[Eubacterium] hominis]|uniref:pyrroline-5-carboxylate reductase n=1 Tax=[Eubacterium] hominis TaxID=2764325 RepID=UPI0022E39DEF
MKTIGFIGCGNMGRAMVEGIMKANLVDGDHMIVSNAHPERLSELSEIYDCYISDNESVAKNSDIVVLAIKPYLYKEVITSIKDIVKDDVIIINIAAGISTQDVVEMFGCKVKTVKAMPNTPAMVQEAMSALSFSDNCDQDDKEDVIAIFESFGQCREVEERLMDAVMVVSGSSPAYIFMVLEAMADGAVMQGLPRNDAYAFAAQAMIGSAKMMLETGKHPGELKDMVCSPAGTTIEAVAKMEEMGLRSAIIEGMRACANRGKEMSKK